MAGGALVESADQQRFAWLIAGATLLFLAGMFLNDAFDVQFDREHRPERPIPSGAITAKTVWVLGIGQLLLGLGCLVWVNTLATLCALGLAASILLYDWLHKRTVWSPMLMGLCRLFLYLLAAASTTEPIGLTVVLCTFALWAYIVGLSNIARREATGGRVNSWPCWLLGLPLALAFALPYWDGGADVSWRGVPCCGCFVYLVDGSKFTVHFQVNDAATRANRLRTAGRNCFVRFPACGESEHADGCRVFWTVRLGPVVSTLHPGNMKPAINNRLGQFYPACRNYCQADNVYLPGQVKRLAKRLP